MVFLMDKEEVLKRIKEWMDKAPSSADFGVVDDIESEDEVLQIFY